MKAAAADVSLPPSSAALRSSVVVFRSSTYTHAADASCLFTSSCACVCASAAAVPAADDIYSHRLLLQQVFSRCFLHHDFIFFIDPTVIVRVSVEREVNARFTD